MPGNLNALFANAPLFGSLQHEVFAAMLAQAVAHDEPGLTTADHDYIVAFPRRIYGCGPGNYEDRQ